MIQRSLCACVILVRMHASQAARRPRRIESHNDRPIDQSPSTTLASPREAAGRALLLLPSALLGARSSERAIEIEWCCWPGPKGAGLAPHLASPHQAKAPRSNLALELTGGPPAGRRLKSLARNARAYAFLTAAAGPRRGGFDERDMYTRLGTPHLLPPEPRTPRLLSYTMHRPPALASSDALGAPLLAGLVAHRSDQQYACKATCCSAWLCVFLLLALDLNMHLSKPRHTQTGPKQAGTTSKNAAVPSPAPAPPRRRPQQWRWRQRQQRRPPLGAHRTRSGSRVSVCGRCFSWVLWEAWGMTLTYTHTHTHSHAAAILLLPTAAAGKEEEEGQQQRTSQVRTCPGCGYGRARGAGRQAKATWRRFRLAHLIRPPVHPHTPRPQQAPSSSSSSSAGPASCGPARSRRSRTSTRARGSRPWWTSEGR